MTVEALTVDAQLSLVSDQGAAVAVSSDGTTITIGITSLWMFIHYRRRLNRRRRLALLKQAQLWLARADLMVEVQVGDVTLALLGPHASPGLLSRVTGLHPLQLRLGAVLTSLFRRG